MGQANATQGRARKSTRLQSFGGGLNVEVRTQSKDLEFYKVKSPPIARGPFGEVREAFHTKLREKYLMKVIFKQQFSETEMRDIQNEFRMLQELAHPNIIGVKEFFDEDRFFYIIQYYFRGRPLFDKVRELGGIRDAHVAAKILTQLAKTLDFINDKNVVYRNLKLENILYNGRQIRLHDFSQAVQITGKQKLSDMVGSIHFVAPEVVKGSYDTRSDIWSFGVVAFVIFFCRYPFDGKDDNAIITRILKDEPDFSTTGLPPPSTAIDLIRKILVKEPEKRFTWRQIHTHEFFTQFRQAEGETIRRLFERVRVNLLSFSIESTFHLAIYLHFLHSFQANVEGSSAVQELFAKIDIRSHGKVSQADIRKFNDEYQLNLSESDCKSIITKLDKDNSGTIEFEEFLAGCIDRRRLLTNERVEAFFSALAGGHPDFVSVEDLQRIFVSQSKQSIQDFFTHWGVPAGEAFTRELFLKMMQSIV